MKIIFPISICGIQEVKNLESVTFSIRSLRQTGGGSPLGLTLAGGFLLAALLMAQSVCRGQDDVERLLASKEYGEQWARHWLDIARYSETKGYVYAREERFWVHAWAYRDWVVDAFNDDRIDVVCRRMMGLTDVHGRVLHDILS